MNSPEFFVRIAASGCVYDIRINDCPLASDADGYPVSGLYPVNDWINPGENTITGTLLPLPGAPAIDPDVSIIGQVFAAPKGSQDAEKDGLAIGRFAFGLKPGPEEGDQSGAPPVPKLPVIAETEEKRIRIAAAFAAETPFPPLFWDQLEPFADPEALMPELIGKSRELWDLLNRRDFDGIREYFAKRTSDLAPRSYLEPAALADAALADYRIVLDDGELPLREFLPSKIVPRFFGYGRLVQPVLEGVGRSPILFTDEGFDLIRELKVYFCRTDEDGLVAIR